jgi:hypothetical protein
VKSLPTPKSKKKRNYVFKALRTTNGKHMNIYCCDYYYDYYYSYLELLLGMMLGRQ